MANIWQTNMFINQYVLSISHLASQLFQEGFCIGGVACYRNPPAALRSAQFAFSSGSISRRVLLAKVHPSSTWMNIRRDQKISTKAAKVSASETGTHAVDLDEFLDILVGDKGGEVVCRRFEAERIEPESR